jgi:hypothetical protein
MPNNSFPNTGSVTLGTDRNFFQKLSVSATGFGSNNATSPYVPGSQPDMIVPFNTQCVIFTNLSLASGTYAANTVVEYSFNGQVVHGELGSSSANISLTFQNRPVAKIWFRLQTGSSGPIIVSVQAWSTQ